MVTGNPCVHVVTGKDGNCLYRSIDLGNTINSHIYNRDDVLYQLYYPELTLAHVSFHCLSSVTSRLAGKSCFV